jgi:riboflavin synthase
LILIANKMFTGITREQGKIVKIEKKENHVFFEVASNIVNAKNVGESVSVDGVCVTIVAFTKNGFCFELVKESLNRSNFEDKKIGDAVNLEPAVFLNQSLDGHMVQGHVDTVAEVLEFRKDGSQKILILDLPDSIEKYIAFKGSVSLNGVSLTVSELQEKNFSVTLIPHTLEKTNLGDLNKGDKVNVEVDIIARYLERLIK